MAYDEEMLAAEGIFIRLLSLPTSIGGMTVYNADDCTYNVYLNSALMPAEQTRAMHHELRHIRRKDFELTQHTTAEYGS